MLLSARTKRLSREVAKPTNGYCNGKLGSLLRRRPLRHGAGALSNRGGTKIGCLRLFARDDLLWAPLAAVRTKAAFNGTDERLRSPRRQAPSSADPTPPQRSSASSDAGLYLHG